MEKQAFEQSGLIPRSIIRTFDRFRKQLLPGAENNIIQEFRISRYQVLVSVKSLIALIVFPIFFNFFLKNLLLTPLIEFFWNNNQTEIFLNSYQQNRALKEIEGFEEKLYFETLLEENLDSSNFYIIAPPTSSLWPSVEQSSTTRSMVNQPLVNPSFIESSFLLLVDEKEDKALQMAENSPIIKKEDLRNQKESLKKQFQQKTIEIAFEYNQQSIIAITNIFGDFFTFLTTIFLLILMKPQVIILKSFLTESIYSLSDTTKSFLLIFFTDLLVGFHSPRGWDLVLEILLKYFGLPENQDFILLFVATFPVLLDTVFKYWIFRYLNKISPSTVATYHNMIE